MSERRPDSPTRVTQHLGCWKNLVASFIIIPALHAAIVILVGFVAADGSSKEWLACVWAGWTATTLLIIYSADWMSRHAIIRLFPPSLMITFVFYLEVISLCTLTRHQIFTYISQPDTPALAAVGSSASLIGVPALCCYITVTLCRSVMFRATPAASGGNESTSEIQELTDKELTILEEGETIDINEPKLIYM